MKTAILALILLPAFSMADAQASFMPAGKIGQPWLQLSSDPRSAALASAVAAAPEGSFDFRLNPAGLSLLMEPQASLGHNEWSTSLGMRQEQAFFAKPLEEGALGLGLNYFSFGSFENRDASGALTDASTDLAYAGSLAFAAPFFNDALRLGISLEASQQALGDKVGSFYGLGAGALYEPFRDLRLGVNAKGLGTGEEGATAPASFALGLSWRTLARKLLFLAQWTKPQAAEAVSGLGLELSLLENFQLRGGWRMGGGDAAEADRGFSAGLGFSVGPAQIDYAFVPYGDLSTAHRASLTFKFSEGLFSGGKIVVEGFGVTQNAQAHYEEGLAAMAARDWGTAKVALDMVLKIYPGFAKAEEVQSRLSQIEKSISAERAHGLSADAKARLRERVVQAKKIVESGDLPRAKKELMAALEFEPSFKEALDLLKEVERKLSRSTDKLKEDANSALSQGDLLTASKKLRACLRIDETDVEARSRLKALGPRLRVEAKKLHRQGINLYVEGELDKAIQVWERGLELDPSDPHSIGRDLQKARKLMELRGSKG